MFRKYVFGALFFVIFEQEFAEKKSIKIPIPLFSSFPIRVSFDFNLYFI